MKIISLSIIFLSFIQFCYAQTNKWEFGMEGGPNQSSVSGSKTPEYQGTLDNYLLGFDAQYNITDNFSINAGINSEIKGYSQTFSYFSRLSGAEPYGTYTNYTSLGYVTFPILAKASIGHKIKFFVNAGPYFGYLVGAPSKVVYQDSVGKQIVSSTSNRNVFKQIDIGACGGVGFEIPLNDKLVFSLEGRYSPGFLNIDNTGSYNFKNQSSDFILGL